jgi:hypothetical protein
MRSYNIPAEEAIAKTRDIRRKADEVQKQINELGHMINDLRDLANAAVFDGDNTRPIAEVAAAVNLLTKLEGARHEIISASSSISWISNALYF